MRPAAARRSQMPPPDSAANDPRCCQPRCCHMLPNAPRCCQILADVPGCHQTIPDATNIAITNTIPGAYTNANANHHHTNINTNTSNYYQYHDHHIAKPSFASRLSALYRDVPVACTTMMMGGQPHIRRPLLIIIDCMQGSSSRLVQTLRRRVEEELASQGPMTKHLIIMFMTFKGSRNTGMFYLFMPKLLETEEPSSLQRRILQNDTIGSGHFAF